MQIDAEGWIEGVLRIPSPNGDQRPEGCAVELVVVHAISLPPDRFGGAAITALFMNALDPDLHPYFATLAGLKVSAHAVIRRDGSVVQFLSFADRAWHAGASCWRGRERCNDFSVGIELEGCDSIPFEPQQYSRLREMVACLRQRFDVADVVGHRDIAPGRKTDPGPLFDWMALA